MLPEASYNRVYRYFHDQGNVFPVRERTLRKQLAEAGYLERQPKRYTFSLRVDGKTVRVLALKREKIWEEENDASEELQDGDDAAA